ncbi:uncharacterized protein PG998_003152 [Apiospora kogelbergensis]|uniref:uncharacterized protein n=1 Tax=Apiospora kogelbergensis TaxID=1337665 RepID=UPI00312F3EDD
MELSFVTLDVFTNKRLEGNPLAVVSVPASLEPELTQAKKQKIAQEFNLSETVFMHEPSSSDDDQKEEGTQLRIDIFTVESELPFAGHPTIGSAVLAKFHKYPGVDTLLTKSGPIRLEAVASAGEDQAVRARIAHDVRQHRHTLADVIPPAQHGSFPGLSHHEPAVRDAELAAPLVSIVRGMTFALVRVPSLELLGRLDAGLRLDFAAAPPLQSLLDADRRPAGFVARYYYVDLGRGGDGVRAVRARMVELGFEDPATGSAASALTAYLTVRDRAENARFEVTQGVEMGRRSVIRVETTAEVEGDGDVKIRELWLGGEAVVVQKGTLMVD